MGCNNPEGSLTVMLGGAGTGKSYVIHAVVNTMTDRYGSRSVLVTSTTGRSAALIGGSTVQGANGLNLNAGPRGTVLFNLTGAALAAHQRKMEHVKVVIMDESSMASQTDFMVAVHRLRQGRAETSKRYGGYHFLLVMDPAQLPPVGAVTLWSTSRAGRGANVAAYSLFTHPDHVVVLQQVKR